MGRSLHRAAENPNHPRPELLPPPPGCPRSAFRAGTAETALVAGYYASGDSARPGFGWFFGRDSLYTLYAINGYGDFALSKAELEFLIHRQRADGKIMHEYSQTAAALDWQAFPYMYAAADSTPLFLLAVEDYVKSSGDVAFLTANREAIEKAWAFETDPAHDTDHDGIYDNSQGTGWVESWPGGMPHQEIYLALLDEQASGAMAGIEKLLGDSAKAASAQQRADKIAKTIESEYYDPEKSCYAFSHNSDGSQDRTSTVYPAMAWWSDKSVSGAIGLAHPEGCLQQLAAHTLNTDWGLRDVANDEKIYDGMSYHQGSVWPLFTGWAALAEYRGGQPLAGYQMLMENANLTWAQDLGADTELLSGDFYVPFGRSTSHQLWSSAMVITPTLRGLFGISMDCPSQNHHRQPTSARVMGPRRHPPSPAALWRKRKRRNALIRSQRSCARSLDERQSPHRIPPAQRSSRRNVCEIAQQLGRHPASRSPLEISRTLRSAAPREPALKTRASSAKPGPLPAQLWSSKAGRDHSELRNPPPRPPAPPQAGIPSKQNHRRQRRHPPSPIHIHGRSRRPRPIRPHQPDAPFPAKPHRLPIQLRLGKP